MEYRLYLELNRTMSELSYLLSKKIAEARGFNFKGYIKDLKLSASDTKKLTDFLNKNKDGVEGPEDVFRAATDLKIKLDENLVNESFKKEFVNDVIISQTVDNFDEWSRYGDYKDLAIEYSLSVKEADKIAKKFIAYIKKFK